MAWPMEHGRGPWMIHSTTTRLLGLYSCTVQPYYTLRVHMRDAVKLSPVCASSLWSALLRTGTGPTDRSQDGTSTLLPLPTAEHKLQPCVASFWMTQPHPLTRRVRSVLRVN